jgi:hypothetical protein
MTIVKVPTEMHGIDYERLGVWCDMHNISVEAVDTEVWILVAMVRGEYAILARAYPDHKLSKCFDRVDARLKILEAAARLFC